jgi:hypothetical protein
MGMSTYVEAYKPPDEKWKEMKAAWDACKAAHVEPPEVVLKFFEGERPDEEGVKLDHFKMLKEGIITKWNDECGAGFQLDLEKLPRDVKTIRFYNSW